jgi:two-component system sensor histidine kinase PhoQ
VIVSVHTRLLAAGMLVVAAFVGLTGVALDEAFRDSARSALEDRLQGHIYALLAAADLGDDANLDLPPELPDARFSTPGSGLYAQVIGNDGSYLWRSPSTLAIALTPPMPLAAGQRAFESIVSGSGESLLRLRFGVFWETGESSGTGYTFSATESMDQYYAEVAGFRRNLWGWLLGLSVGLLALQGSILRWSLSPLRRAAEDVRKIEAGAKALLEGDYPAELRGLTENLNALLQSERARLDRYRNTLGDLAHSLKTPLSVLRNAAEHVAEGPEAQHTVNEQVDRMSRIVDYQLQRAAVSGHQVLSAPVTVELVLLKVLRTLEKVYAERRVQWSCGVEKGTVFFGDEGDLLELTGNLLDNAFKWCAGRVSVTGTSLQPGLRRRPGLRLEIADDGPGIPPEQRDMVLQRGGRADHTKEGHGIGLGVVREIAGLHEGTVSIGVSSMGGALIRLEFPPS